MEIKFGMPKGKSVKFLNKFPGVGKSWHLVLSAELIF